MFKGSAVALVTPMQPDGTIDFKALHALVEWHLVAKTQALVVAGTTGESATLSSEEQLGMIEQVVRWVAGKMPVIAGCGTYSTQTTIAKAKAVQEAGVQGCLVVTPYYNRPTQRGLIAHYEAVANAVGIPLILYNVPKRTGCDLLPKTVAQLSGHPNIIGIKEATGDLGRLAELRSHCQAGFLFYSGDDASACDFIKQGGDGLISVSANAIPELIQQLCHYALSAQNEKADQLNERLVALHQALGLEANPIPIKWLLYHLQKISIGIRLPLTVLSESFRIELEEAYQQVEI